MWYIRHIIMDMVIYKTPIYVIAVKFKLIYMQ